MTTQEQSIPWIGMENGTIINDTSLPTDQILTAMSNDPNFRSISGWINQTQNPSGSMFERDRYHVPNDIHKQFTAASRAAKEDDIVSNVLELSESLAFGRIDFESDNEEEEDIWNQIAEDVELTERLKEMWRELFVNSQFYAYTWWGMKDYKLRGKSEATGIKRKKSYGALRVPQGITLLDPCKVAPIGNFMFNRQQYIYLATLSETTKFREVLRGERTDPIVANMITKEFDPYDLTEEDMAVVPQNTGLFLLSDNVWRYGLTKQPYERYSPVRLRPVFELLDLKQQLRAMDRAVLVGSTNFIVVMKKGSDEHRAQRAELDALAVQAKSVARVPLIISDHRLEIEIVTPKNDTILKPERYNLLNAQIEARLLNMFLPGQTGAGTKDDDSIKLAKVVARSLESRRDGLVEAFRNKVIVPTVEKNDSFVGNTELKFHPKRIALSIDPAVMQYIQDLRDRGDVSRESVLDEMEFDQDAEALKRKREKDKYDKIFTPTTVPYDGQNQTGSQNNPGSTDPKGQGRRLGGANPDSFRAN